MNVFMKKDRLVEDVMAPSFEVVDISGNQITPVNSNDSYTLLSFFRYAGCPWCNLAIYQLTEAQKILAKKGVRVVVFMPSSNENINRNIVERHAPTPVFPLVGDSKLAVYQLYKIENSYLAGIRSIAHLDKWQRAAKKLGFPQADIDGSLTLVPAQFLIDNQTGKILKAHYGVNYADTTTFIDIYDKVLFQD